MFGAVDMKYEDAQGTGNTWKYYIHPAAYIVVSAQFLPNRRGYGTLQQLVVHTVHT